MLIGEWNIENANARQQDSIYSGVKETVNNTTRGIYMDNDGQIAFGDSSQYIKFYRVSEGKYKLSIAVDDLYIGTLLLIRLVRVVLQHQLEHG